MSEAGVTLEQLDQTEVNRLAQEELERVPLLYSATKVDRSRSVYHRAEELITFGMNVIQERPALNLSLSRHPIRLLRHLSYELLVNNNYFLLRYNDKDHAFTPTAIKGHDNLGELYGRESGATNGLANMSKVEFLRRLDRGLKKPMLQVNLKR